MRLLAAAALLASASACKFPFPADVPDDADPPTDAHGTDSSTVACEADTITCDDAQGVYVECSPTGTVVRSIDCPLGCAPDEVKIGMPVEVVFEDLPEYTLPKFRPLK